MKKRTALKLAVIAVAGGSLGALIAYSPKANASWVRQSAFACYASAFTEDNQYGLYDTNSSGSTPVDCPVPDDDRTPKGSWVTANVEVYMDLSNSVEAEACYGDWDGEYGGCSGTSVVNGPGHYTISLGYWIGGGGGNYWNTGGGTDFGYVWVGLQWQSRIAGVYYST